MYKYILNIFKEKGFTVEYVASYLDISKVNLYKKINGKVKFSLVEAQKLANLLDMTIETLFNTRTISISETSNLS